MLLTFLYFRSSRTIYFIVGFGIVVEFCCFADGNSTTASTKPSTSTESDIHNGRYLVFPTPGTFVPTKVQLIAGLGLPMEADVSTIVGYVMKFNYALPYNASYLTEPHATRYDRSIDPRRIRNRRQTENPEREKYKDEKYETVEKEAPKAGDREVKKDEGSTSRWEMYRVIVSVLDGFRLSGKSCLLKTVCQVAEVPFDNSRAGLVAQLIHVLFTPSMTGEKYVSWSDQEYHSAEAAGRDCPGKCKFLFPECQHDILEYFTETNDVWE